MNSKRLLVNAGIVLALALLAWYCYDAGKSYRVRLENVAYLENGVEQPALEALNAIIDKGGKPFFMLEGDITFAPAVGKAHDLIIEILDIDDKVVETKVIPFDISDLDENLVLNVARAYNEGSI